MNRFNNNTAKNYENDDYDMQNGSSSQDEPEPTDELYDEWKLRQSEKKRNRAIQKKRSDKFRQRISELFAVTH